jgi:nicotinamidase-related amidase
MRVTLGLLPDAPKRCIVLIARRSKTPKIREEAMRMPGRVVTCWIVAAASLGALWAPATVALAANTIIDEWSSVQVPPPPKLEPVTVDPKTTAVLALDFIPTICNKERRPRCLASLPAVAKLIKGARESKTLVVYSVAGSAKPTDILPPVTPLGGEPVVRSHADKFLDTDLEKILKDKGIKTLVVVGTTAEGAILYTGSHAALLGFNVIVPVDGVSATLPYAEQYVAWDLSHAPGIAAKVKLTTVDMVKF